MLSTQALVVRVKNGAVVSMRVIDCIVGVLFGCWRAGVGLVGGDHEFDFVSATEE